MEWFISHDEVCASQQHVSLVTCDFHSFVVIGLQKSRKCFLDYSQVTADGCMALGAIMQWTQQNFGPADYKNIAVDKIL